MTKLSNKVVADKIEKLHNAIQDEFSDNRSIFREILKHEISTNVYNLQTYEELMTHLSEAGVALHENNISDKPWAPTLRYYNELWKMLKSWKD